MALTVRFCTAVWGAQAAAHGGGGPHADANRRLIIREVEARVTRAALVQTDEADNGTPFRRRYGMILSSYLTRMRVYQAQYLLIPPTTTFREAPHHRRAMGHPERSSLPPPT